MTHRPEPFFPHRQNRDGSFDSICLQCFATVANAMDVAELGSYEKEHVCKDTLLANRSLSRQRRLRNLTAA
jgi:hypothetical protein